MPDLPLSPWMADHLTDQRLHQFIGTSRGYVMLCDDHMTAIVLQHCVHNLREAREGRRPWRLDQNQIWVEASYAQWWQELRIGRRPMQRLLNRLRRRLSLIQTSTLKPYSGTLGSSVLHVCVQETELQAAWTDVQTLGSYEPQPLEN